MPYSVKISELPVRQTALPDDIVPVVDAAETQTSTVTAAMIAAIGGGPPADASVTTVKLANGAVTYPKIQNVTADRILGRATAGAGVVEEIACTPLARTVLAATTSAAMCSAMGALASTVDATFSGPVKFPNGSQGAPAITNTGDTDTGLFFPLDNALGFSTDGYERFRIGSDGTQYSNFPGTSVSTELRAQFVCRAWINFDGSAGSTTVINSQHTIAARYGRTGSLLNDPNTRAKIRDLEAGFGNTLTDANIGTVGTEGRSNYTTPGDNVHWRWNSSNVAVGAWEQVPAATGNWIGNITFTSASNVFIRNSGNVTSLTDNGVGNYTINFLAPMPDTQYAAVGSCTRNSTTPTVVCLTNLATASLQVVVANANTTASLFDATTVCVAVFR
jgi:hypothetical protein